MNYYVAGINKTNNEVLLSKEPECSVWERRRFDYTNKSYFEKAWGKELSVDRIIKVTFDELGLVVPAT